MSVIKSRPLKNENRTCGNKRFSPAIGGGNQMTIGELRDELDEWPESFEIIFGCPELEFYRLKKRAGDLLQLEFNQTIYKDSETGKWHVDE
jgi:hypothetical protein